MTATIVNGSPVVGHETVVGNLGIRFSRQLLLRLADGSVVYGCGVEGCAFTTDKIGQVRHHLGSVHKDNPKTQHSVIPTTDRAGRRTTLGLVSQLAKELERTSHDRDRWRRRATAAEKDLGAIRRALGTAS